MEDIALDTRIVHDSESARTMGVPKVRDDWPNKLWEAIRNAKDGSLTIKSAPFETISEHPQGGEQDLESLYGDAGSQKSEDSKAKSLKTLPSYLGNVRALMSTPVNCTITLAELLRLRPKMWDDLGLCLEKLGIKDPVHIEHAVGPRAKRKIVLASTSEC